MSHTFPDGSERLVAFASRTLISSENNYSQIEKGPLVSVWDQKVPPVCLWSSFHVGDRPSTACLDPGSEERYTAFGGRHWALILSAYSYDISYRAMGAHANADGLSRLPLNTPSVVPSSEQSILNVLQIQTLPIKAGNVATASRRDPVLNKVCRYLKDGWPREVPEPLIPYARNRNELTAEGDCLLWGMRVIIPPRLCHYVLQELHTGHPRVVCMKQLARSHVCH